MTVLGDTDTCRSGEILQLSGQGLECRHQAPSEARVFRWDPRKRPGLSYHSAFRLLISSGKHGPTGCLISGRAGTWLDQASWLVREPKGGLAPGTKRTKVLSVSQPPPDHTLGSWGFSAFHRRSWGTSGSPVPGAGTAGQTRAPKESPSRLAGLRAHPERAAASQAGKRVLTCRSLECWRNGREEFSDTPGGCFTLWPPRRPSPSTEVLSLGKASSFFLKFESP